MDLIDLGGARLHVATVLPGQPGEGERLVREVCALDPAVVLLDVDTEEGLRLREALGERRGVFEPKFVDALFASQVHARFGRGGSMGEHPFLSIARAAQKRHAALVALRPSADDPGWLARRRARRTIGALPTLPCEEFVPAFQGRLNQEIGWDPAADAQAAWPRLERALTEGRAPLVALLQAHRAAPLLREVRGAGRMGA